MKVLILNPGSESLRFAVIAAAPPRGDLVRGREVLSDMIAPIVGAARFSVQKAAGRILREEKVPVKDHAEAASQLFARMHWTPAHFDLMALRMMQVGTCITSLCESTIRSSRALKRWDLAALHHASSVTVFLAFQTALRGSVPGVAIFDSGFTRLFGLSRRPTPFQTSWPEA